MSLSIIQVKKINFIFQALLLIKPSMQFLKFLLSWIRQIYKAILLSSATWTNFSLLHHRPEKRLGLQNIPGRSQQNNLRNCSCRVKEHMWDLLHNLRVCYLGGTTVILKKIQSDRFLMTTHIFRDSGSISRSRRDDVARNLGQVFLVRPLVVQSSFCLPSKFPILIRGLRTYCESIGDSVTFNKEFIFILLILFIGPISFPIFGALWLYSRFGPYERSKYHLSNEDKFARYGPVVRESGFMNFPLIHLYHKDDILTVTKFRSDMPM